MTEGVPMRLEHTDRWEGGRKMNAVAGGGEETAGEGALSRRLAMRKGEGRETAHGKECEAVGLGVVSACEN